MIQKWFDAAKSGNIQVLKQALADGYDINTIDGKHNTALHHATKQKKYDTMRFLIENGAHLQMQNDWLSTPLHLCEKNIDAIRILLEAGADPNILDKDYDYPYYFAFYGSMTQELSDLYIKHGAKLVYKKDM
ncbi:MAG TPA: ankyrin repeat domain-containing protein [Ghiorsea sp.]|nr:ankyrin repeat domain-containing protein [Ghiorsea sp.]HIP07303.1 ankyrin repeat domain-containing protein [Mariprofundaceae bacterium]